MRARRVAGLASVLLALAMGTAPAPCRADEPPDDPAASAAEDWRREALELERRAADADVKQDHAAALDLRTAAVALIRRHSPDSRELARALDAAAGSSASLGSLASALALREESLALLRRQVPGDDRDAFTLLVNLAFGLDRLGRPEEALARADEALAMGRRLFADGHSDLVNVLGIRGNVLGSLGRTPEALTHHEEALAMARRLAAGDHPDVLTALGNVGLTLVALGRATEGLERLEDALAMSRRIRSGDHTDVATMLANGAMALDALSRHAEAIPRHEEALAMLRRLLPGDQPDAVSILNNLAISLERAGRPSDALARYAEALAMMRRLVPGDHPHVALLLSHCGDALGQLGRSSEALPLHQEALDMLRRLFPGDHPDVAIALNNQALALRELGCLQEARTLLAESLGMRRRLFAQDHPVLATGLSNLADVLVTLGRPAEALPLNEEALAMSRRMFPGDHSIVAHGMSSLAKTLCSLDRWGDALDLYEQSLQMARRLSPGDHPDLATDLGNRARALDALGRRSESLADLEQASAMLGRMYPGDHPAVARGLGNLAAGLLAADRAPEALERGHESLAMLRRLYAGDHPDLALSLANLANMLEKERRVAEALPLQEEALAMSQRLFPEDHESVALALAGLARILDVSGRRVEALARYREAYEMASRLGSPDRWTWGTALGTVHLRDGRAGEAVEPLRVAVEALEAARADARGLRTEDRAQFVASMRSWADPYELLSLALARLGDPTASFDVLERGRGREVLDLLRRGEVDLVGQALARAHGRGDEAAVARLRSAVDGQAAAEARLLGREQAVERARAQPGTQRAEIRTLQAAVSSARRDLTDALTALQRLLRDEVPGARPLPAGEVQARLAPDERLLACSVSVLGSRGLLVGRDTLEAFEIASEGLQESLTTFAADLSMGTAVPASDLAREGRRLFDLLIPRRIWDSLSGVRRLYVMADGVLTQVPLETLVVTEVDGRPVPWAQVGPPIAYESSASALAWLLDRARGLQGAADLVAIGDPVFAGRSPPVEWPSAGVLLTEARAGGQAERLGLRAGDVLVSYDGRELADPSALRLAIQAAGDNRSDIRIGFVRDGDRGEVIAASGLLGVSISVDAPSVAGPRLRAQGPVATTLRAALERGKNLAPLPGTRREIEAITDAFRAGAGARTRMTTLLGREARERAVFDACDRPRVLHFATHGILDETEAGSFSSLALTMPTVPVPGDDGFLTLGNLLAHWQGRLEGTDLVVLSACESTKGAARRGEGMVALPWGFLYAGARAVVGSLWKVDDECTAYLMSEFYRLYLADGHRDALDALRGARLATMAKFPHPNRWGAFVLTGAPR